MTGRRRDDANLTRKKEKAPGCGALECVSNGRVNHFIDA
jgi:hypothetical protein